MPPPKTLELLNLLQCITAYVQRTVHCCGFLESHITHGVFGANFLSGLVARS